VIRGWDGQGELLCAGLRYAVCKTKNNRRYTARTYRRVYPPPMVTTKPDISDIAHEEYGNGTFSLYERLEDGEELAKTGTLRLDNGYFRAVCLYDPAQVAKVVCRRTDDWVGVYLQPAPAPEIVLTRRLVFPLAAHPLCQTMVKQQTERAERVQATMDGGRLTLSGPVIAGAPVLIRRLPGLCAGMVIVNAKLAVQLRAYNDDYLIAVVDVPGEYHLHEGAAE